MRTKIIFLTVSLALLLGASDNVWGQIGVLAPEYLPNVAPQPNRPARITQQDVTQRRSDGNGTRGFINAPNTAATPPLDTQNNVNNEFGAGESSKISPSGSGPIVTNPTPRPSLFLTPIYSNPLLSLTTTPSVLVSDIQLGSDYSQNVVIRTYVGNGFAMGWISVVNYTVDQTAPPSALPGFTYSGSTAINSATLYDEISPYILSQYKYEAPNYLAPVTNPNPVLYPTYYPLTEFSFNKFNALVFQPYPTGSWGEGSGGAGSVFSTSVGGCGRPVFQSTVVPVGANGTRITVWNHNATGTTRRYDVTPTDSPVDIYTSTIDDVFQKEYAPGYYNNSTTDPTIFTFPIDDGIPLVQFNGLELKSGLALNSSPDPLVSDSNDPDGDLDPDPSKINPTSKHLANYKRPTTILVDAGSYIFSNFNFKNINWWYEQNNVTTSNLYLGDLGTCGSGASSAFGFSVLWTKAISSAPAETLVDGAIVLIANALVCVTGDVTDGTTDPASIHTTGSSPNEYTDAILTLPNNGRFTLRVKGNYNYLNMFQQATNGDNYYSQGSFPVPLDNIYLYPSPTPTAYPTPFDPTWLNVYNGSLLNPVTVANIAAPTPSSVASIFGVYLDYNWMANNADIHTTAFNSTPAQIVNNPGVIEIGPTTAGKSHFHVYSGGLLKNFEGCTPITNFTMNFGDDYGDIPNFYLDGVEDLSILNYGNNSADFCDAKIIFHAGSTAAIAKAFTAPTVPNPSGATDAGAFRIQALSNVELHEDAAINATLLGNNLYLLSDGGNIITQKFDITSDYRGTVGQGLITFWAEDRELTGTPGFGSCANVPAANRNGQRGNIYLNDDVEITRTLTSTETNMIAANNIRTASFTVNSGNSGDITNIISRKGDLYLGYSAGVNVYSIDPVLFTEVYDSNGKTGNTNVFTYNGTGASGTLNILAGYDDQNNTSQFGGGNIYITKLVADMTVTGSGGTPVPAGTHDVNVMIPFSNEFRCEVDSRLSERLNPSKITMQQYEHAGIILGAGRCGIDYVLAATTPNDYAALLENPTTAALNNVGFPSLVYNADMGEKIFDTGARGNIINNMGAQMDFYGRSVNAYFRTRSGDIDMRNKTDVKNLASGQSIVFLADNGDPDKSKIGGTRGCDCDEENNNVYFQDFDFEQFTTTNDGSIFIGADNNIKLQYGGLRDIGTWKDPFLNEHLKTLGYPCGSQSYHCDSDPSVNRARTLDLDFSKNTGGGGGIGIVASDLIDVYKKMVYTGGSASMPAVPAKSSINGITSPGGALHGEYVAGYGLYIKSQGNKHNWSSNPFDLIDVCPKGCPSGDCGNAFLHEVSRVTFHDDARILAEGSKVYIGSPVLEVYGPLELNTDRNWLSSSLLRIQTDSLIVHDSLIVEGSHLQLNTWSNLDLNMPVLKFGHQRRTPYFEEAGCKLCYTHDPVDGSILNRTALDTIFVTFHQGASFNRFHSLIADHTVLTFLTDSFEHSRGNPVIDAKFYTDIFKVRNQVELWGDINLERSGHFELISEAQMHSKDYSGIFARHLHLEPISPCGTDNYSDLWLQERALDVTSSTRVGGYGTIHADVHVETQAILAPGYASLGIRGNCYERIPGSLKMNDLRLDKGAQLHYSIGDVPAGLDVPATDYIEVDDLTLYGEVDVYVEKRCDQTYTPGCYPIILYKTAGVQNLNHLLLGTLSIDGYPLSLDFSTPGIVYLCVGENAKPIVQREVILPTPPAGVSIYPVAGAHYVPWGYNFIFTLAFSGPVYEIRTNRFDNNGIQEILTGTLTANGEYEYVLPFVKTQPLYIYIGPNTVANEWVDRDAVVWSNGATLYINVKQQDIASIYSITGLLVKRIEVPDGGTSLPMQKGVFIVTLKDGSVHKVIIR